MNIAILGSAGQIGAYLKNFLQTKGHIIHEIDIMYGPKHDLRMTPNKFIEGIIKNSDFVFFLAFDVGGSHYLKKYQNTFQFINNNTQLMANTFDLLNKYNKKFVFASSQMSNMGYSPYGITKRIGELHTISLKGLTVKFWNVYGIEHDMEKAHVITDFIKKGFEEKEFKMMTDGKETRQFLYAEDCCEALETVMNKYDHFKPEDSLHITSFKFTSIKEIAKIIQKNFLDINMKVIIKPGSEKDTVQMDKNNQASEYITSWWKPKTSIEEGIKKIFEEMKNEYEKNKTKSI